MVESPMTKEDWQKVEKALSGTYGRAELLVDGRRVVFQRGLVAKNRLGIATYIDGEFRGEWMLPKVTHPEQQYLNPVWHFAGTPKQRAAWSKMTKSMKKLLGPALDPTKKFLVYHPTWTSATAIRRHYQKTFTSIELIGVIG